MATKTDKNFIYDYLIHLDSFLLHGVSEVGAPVKTPLQNNLIVKKSDSLPRRNPLSPIAFVAMRSFAQYPENIFNADELVLFQKIVAAMSLDSNDVYLTSIQKSEKVLPELESHIQINDELSQVSSKYVVCFGSEVAYYFTNNKIEGYHLEETWQEIELFQKNISLIVIPSITEMITDPRHKKIAWAHLKKISEQILETL